ncbi:MAG: hypothetical protein LBJ78_01590 [Puniceicoccales bacterium]|jgi:hypothetical protein|nr:hypothetical protein [Puniceicoccales bacterium]
MQKTVCTIIKTGLMVVDLIGVVTLNAGWYCCHCYVKHEFDICPSDGCANLGLSRVADFPHVGYVIHYKHHNGKEAIYGPVLPDGTYRTLSHTVVQKIEDQWFLATKCEG